MDKTVKITNSILGFFIKKDIAVSINAANASQMVTSPGITISKIEKIAVAIVQNNAPI